LREPWWPLRAPPAWPAHQRILSFDWRTLAVVQREAPAIPTVYLNARQR